MTDKKTLFLIGIVFLAVVLGCASQKSINSPPTANQTENSNAVIATAFKIPSDSVPAVEITRAFDDTKGDLQAAIKKWRNKRVTFHGTVYTVEKGDAGKFKVSIAGHENFFTVFCRDIPASQESLVATLKEDQTIIAITGVILGNGITGLVPGQVDHDVLAEKCKIVE